MTVLTRAPSPGTATIGFFSKRKRLPFDARTLLKQRTAPAHEMLEQQPALAALSAGRLTRAGYAAVLSVFRDWYAMAEPWIAARIGPLAPPDLPARLIKTGRLRADLAELAELVELVDLNPVTARTAAIALPDMKDPRAALGLLYVMEGATLGGQIILRRLAASPETATLPTRFFTAYGGENGLFWRRFCTHLQTALPTPADADVAAKAACIGFATLGAAIAESGMNSAIADDGDTGWPTPHPA